MINTRYVLPASIAASAHLALLLAFPLIRPPLASVPADPPVQTVVREVPTDVFAPPPPPAEPGGDQVKPLQSSEESAPSLEELALDRRSDFTAPVNVTGPQVIRTLVEVPVGPGVTNGDTTGVPGRIRPISGIGDLDAVPRARVQPAPVYPFAMRQAGRQGSATIHFVVDQTGRVVSADLVSATEREFGEAAIRAVRQWRFEPGRRHGRTVPFQMSVPVQFRLDDL